MFDIYKWSDILFLSGKIPELFHFNKRRDVLDVLRFVYDMTRLNHGAMVGFWQNCQCGNRTRLEMEESETLQSRPHGDR